MFTNHEPPKIQPPKGTKMHVRSAVLHVVSPFQYAARRRVAGARHLQIGCR